VSWQRLADVLLELGEAPADETREFFEVVAALNNSGSTGKMAGPNPRSTRSLFIINIM
jgi:hypothetical protein